VGVNHRSPNIGDGADESEDRMQEYLREYEHRQRERAFFKKMNQARRNSPGGIPASSVHQQSLHGHSYHGRKIISSSNLESLDTTSDNMKKSTNSGASDEHDMKGQVERAIESTV